MPQYTQLSINDFKVSVNLGVSQKERARKQTVLLTILIDFAQIPAACRTDNIEDAVCYATLTNLLKKHLTKRSYQLVEALAADLYAQVKTITPKNARVVMKITKFPQISGLRSGIHFHYGDTIKR